MINVSGNVRWSLALAAGFLVIALAFAGVFAFRPLLTVVYSVALLGGVVLLVWAVTGPLANRLAAVRVSLRWKVVVAISLMAGLFVFVSLVNFGAMQYMHDETHKIQDIWKTQPSEVEAELELLNDTQHGLLFSLTPALSVSAASIALLLGLAVAASVIRPLRQMKEAMGRIASGDFSHPVAVPNGDEIGELALRLNQATGDLARLHEATLLEQRQHALQERIAHVTMVQEEERRRISRELHDDLGPSLAALANRLRSCIQLVRSEPSRVEGEIEEAAAAVKGYIQRIRRLIYDLRPMALDQLGLKDALLRQADEFTVETGIVVACEIRDGQPLDPIAEVSVFRVVQECLENIRKHSGATRVEVRIVRQGAGHAVTVEDNGRGFELRRVSRDFRTAGEGIGIESMRERARLLGGDLGIRTGAGLGCQVTLFIPLREVTYGSNTSTAG